MKSGWPRRLLLLVGGTVAALFVAAAILTAAGADRPQDPAPETVEQASSSPRGVIEPEDPPPLYRLGVYQGRVSVFPPEGDQPIRITETPEAALPEPDRRSLAEGIYVYSREELAGLLEDYGS